MVTQQYPFASLNSTYSNSEAMTQLLRVHYLTVRTLRLTGYHTITPSRVRTITQVANISGGRAPTKRRTRVIGGTRPPTTSTISGIQCASSDRAPILSSYKPDVRRNRERCHEDTSLMSPTQPQRTTRDGESRSPKAYDCFCLVAGVPSTPSYDVPWY